MYSSNLVIVLTISKEIILQIKDGDFYLSYGCLYPPRCSRVKYILMKSITQFLVDISKSLTQGI